MNKHHAQDKRTLQGESDRTAAGPLSGSPSTEGLDSPQPEEHVVSTETAVTSLTTPDDPASEVTAEDLRTVPPGAVTDEDSAFEAP